MNMHAHLSGQISRQVSNQAGNQLPGLSQQNGSSIPNRIPSLGGNHNTMNLEPELVAARQFVRGKIKEFIMQRQKNSSNLSEKRLHEIVRCLEEALWQKANTKEEYVNLGTLENRVLGVIGRSPSSNHNQQYTQRSNSPSVIGTMMPTPGIPPNGNSNIMAASSVGMVSTAGSISNGYQQPTANFSVRSTGNVNMSSVGLQRMTSQMIPTPGFNNSNNPPLTNMNSSSGTGLFSAVESAKLSQPVMQKQHAGSGQTSRMSHNLGSHIGGGSGSGLLQKSHNGDFSGDLGQSNLRSISGPGTSLNSAQFGEHTPGLLQQHYDQHQQPMVQDDGYRMVAPDSFGPGNFYGHMSSSVVGKNNQNLKPSNFPSTSRTNSPMIFNQSKLQTAAQHAVDIIPIEQSENMNYPAPHSSQESLLLSHPQEQSQQQPYLIHQQFYHQDLPKQQSQQNQEIRSQPLHTQRIVLDSKNDFSCSDGMQGGRLIPGNWDAKLHDRSQITSKFSHDENLEENFRQRMTGKDEAHRNNLSFDGDFCPTAITRTEPTNSVGISCRSVDPTRERQFKKQLRWMLLLLHARRCMAPEGKCQEAHCLSVQQLLKHMNHCNASQCKFPRCHNTKVLVRHRKHCKDPFCPVCIPVKNFLERQPKLHARLDLHPGYPSASVNGSCEAYNSPDASARVTPKAIPSLGKSSEDLQPSLKRIKMEPLQPLDPDGDSLSISIPTMGVSNVPLSAPCHEYINSFPCTSTKVELTEVKMEIQAVPGSAITSDMKDTIDNGQNQKPANAPSTSEVPAGYVKKGFTNIETEIGQSKQEHSDENRSETKSGKPNLKGVSLIELFSPEQVREHIRGLRQWVGQSKAKVEKIQAMEHSMTENSCQLCAAENLTFEPPPIYCTPCGARVKRNAMYYTIGAGDTRHYFCIPCYNEARGDSILVDGTMMPKGKLEKKKNDEETEEWWVQCDKCEAWQHQICALFNGRRNDGGEAEYTCPNCYMAEVEKGERKPLPQSAVLGAKDLPRTILSDHIEQRLFKRLKQERQDRARLQGKSYDEVPGAEALVVRVVSSVDKKLEVKPRFLEIFQEENYPLEFPYKSKVVLLFQRIEGVEVCLFGMYVQEFGSECQQPNHRRVYLSYLDSVKYFRPEIRAATGEALRTFVYHEILIGYLEYCKKRGFTSCYIWACPPLKGEDYILYCHPEIQKTPKSDKLREWYLSMLKKASKENVVVGLTNLYDHFFLSHGECKAKVTAVRLPYFDGDYWPGSAEDMIYQLRQEEEGRKQLKKGTNKKPISKRALKASGQTDLTGNASKDLLLMFKLGETIAPMKEDFIMVHLQHACSHCCLLMVSGNRWVCNQCKNFQLCDRCYEAEQKLDERDKHPLNQRDKHVFHPMVIDDVSEDTRDKDEILESEFFDTRQAFLSLCQGNHYQYDTLRRAKHSSMMVLYHLHNPTAPAFVTTCNRCHLDIETGQGWRCETCPDFDVCNNCFQKDGGIDHPHKLTNHPSMADSNAQNTEARQLRVVQLRKMLDLLVHASQCRSPTCQYPNCRKVKGLFRHGIHCKTRASGGCPLCKKMWYLLQLHARACKESQCPVPRCRDLKEHVRRLQQQSDSRRRAAVMEMMRQRAAEVSGNNE